MEPLLITIFCLLFTVITVLRFHAGLFMLIMLLPTYLIRFQIGPIPTTLLEMMILIILLVWIIKYHKKIPPAITYLFSANTGLFVAAALFSLAACWAVFLSVDLRSALGEWKAFYIEPVLLFLVLATTVKKRQIPFYITALIISGTATSLLAVYQHFTGWMVPWDFWENRDSFRVTAWYGFPNAVGLFIAPLIPLGAYLLISAIKNIKKSGMAAIKNTTLIALSGVFLVLGISAIIFAKSTGGLVGAVFAIWLLLLFYKKTRLPVLMLAALTLIVIIAMPGSNPQRQELLLRDHSGRLRVNMWAETVEYLNDNPLTGAGLASYPQLIYPYRIDKWVEVFHHPHNIFLTMWVNLGLLGVVAFIWLPVAVARGQISDFLNHHSLPLSGYFLIATLSAVIVTGLVDSPYIKNDLAVFFWLLLALLVVSRQKNNPQAAFT